MNSLIEMNYFGSYTRVCVASLLLCLLLVGCDTSQDELLAKQKVLEIRGQFKNGSGDLVYEQASERFKQVVKKSDFLDLVKDVYEELGSAAKFQLSSTKVSYDPKHGSLVTILWEPSGESEILKEEYVFAKEDGELRLINYRFITRQ